jgi:hypothetical protein
MELFTCCDNTTKLCYVGQTAYSARTHTQCLIQDLYWNAAGFILKQNMTLIIFN